MCVCVSQIGLQALWLREVVAGLVELRRAQLRAQARRQKATVVGDASTATETATATAENSTATGSTPSTSSTPQSKASTSETSAGTTTANAHPKNE